MPLPSQITGTDTISDWRVKENQLKDYLDTEFIAAGTSMTFLQSAAPTGWTQDNTNNDRVLRVVNTAGAGTGGDWTMSGVSTDPHTLLTTEIPAHTHAVWTSDNSDAKAWGLSRVEVNGVGGQWLGTGTTYKLNGGDGVQTIQNTGSGGGHSHGIGSAGTWRPSYADAIVCTKD